MMVCVGDPLWDHETRLKTVVWCKHVVEISWNESLYRHQGAFRSPQRRLVSVSAGEKCCHDIIAKLVHVVSSVLNCRWAALLLASFSTTATPRQWTSIHTQSKGGLHVICTLRSLSVGSNSYCDLQKSDSTQPVVRSPLVSPSRWLSAADASLPPSHVRPPNSSSSPRKAQTGMTHTAENDSDHPSNHHLTLHYHLNRRGQECHPCAGMYLSISGGFVGVLLCWTGGERKPLFGTIMSLKMNHSVEEELSSDCWAP